MKSRLVLVTITAGLLIAAVAGALLYVDWRSGVPVDPSEALELDELNASTILEMQEGLADRVAGSMTSEQQDRMQSALGLAMFRRCVEWTELNENHPSETSASNEQRACAEFRHYVETGETPR